MYLRTLSQEQTRLHIAVPSRHEFDRACPGMAQRGQDGEKETKFDGGI
jgi:hypothetical protein